MGLGRFLKRMFGTEVQDKPILRKDHPWSPAKFDLPPPSPPILTERASKSILLDGDDAWRIDLPPVELEIDYEDAGGNLTRRSVSVRALRSAATAPILMAVCHMRRAVRHFRIDRIERCVDQDGVIVSPQEFLLRYGIEVITYGPEPTSEPIVAAYGYSAFGIPLTEEVTPIVTRSLSAKRPPDGPLSAAAARERFRPALSVLVGLARSDGAISDEEIEVILDYIQSEAAELGIPIEDPYASGLQSMLRSMRTRDTSLPNYVRIVNDYRDTRRSRFIAAARRVVDADGVVALGEIDFWAQVEEWMRQEDAAILARIEDPTTVHMSIGLAR